MQNVFLERISRGVLKDIEELLERFVSSEIGTLFRRIDGMFEMRQESMVTINLHIVNGHFDPHSRNKPTNRKKGRSFSHV